MQVVVPSDEIQLSRMKQQGKPAVIKGGKGVIAAAPLNERREPPEKPSILNALKQGAEKSRQHDKPDKALPKSKETEL
jgi:hypothetical protein